MRNRLVKSLAIITAIATTSLAEQSDSLEQKSTSQIFLGITGEVNPIHWEKWWGGIVQEGVSLSVLPQKNLELATGITAVSLNYDPDMFGASTLYRGVAIPLSAAYILPLGQSRKVFRFGIGAGTEFMFMKYHDLVKTGGDSGAFSLMSWSSYDDIGTEHSDFMMRLQVQPKLTWTVLNQRMRIIFSPEPTFLVLMDEIDPTFSGALSLTVQGRISPWKKL